MNAKRIYLDTAPVIYLVERIQPFLPQVLQRLQGWNAYVVSDMTRFECRIKPLRQRDWRLLTDYEQFFREPYVELLTLSSAIMDKAAEIRADYNFETPDSIHLAAAVVAGCDAFLTNDLRLSGFTEIAIITL